MQYPLSSFFLRGCVARRSKAAHISRSSPHQVLGNSHEKRLDVDEVLYQHYVKKLLVGYLTVRLFSRVLGADDAPFRPVMGKRGEAGAAAGTVATGAGSSSSG